MATTTEIPVTLNKDEILRYSRHLIMREVGMEGRATGPHLCWRMKWRARNCDPTLLVGVSAPTA